MDGAEQQEFTQRNRLETVVTCMTETESGYLYYICVNDVVLRQEPVSHLLFPHRRGELETFQVFLQQLGHLGDVTPLHRPQARRLGALQGVQTAGDKSSYEIMP